MSDNPLRDLGCFSERQWWRMCDVNLGLPEPLGTANLSLPFVYERRLGVMFCPMGHHQAAMALLLAFQHGSLSAIDTARSLNLHYSDGCADHWLANTPGAAFRSSVGKRITAWSPSSLNAIERRIFCGAAPDGAIDYAGADAPRPLGRGERPRG